jgi:hypothetical protein
MRIISITSIICGTALILAPIVHDMLLTSMIAQLLETTREPASITSALGPSYSPWCMIIGASVIVSGLLLGIRVRCAPEAAAKRLA